LTRRQREVFGLVVQGLPNAEIARRLGVSEAAIKATVSRLLRRFGKSSRVELAYAGGVAASGRPEHGRWAGALWGAPGVAMAVLRGPDHVIVALNDAARALAGLDGAAVGQPLRALFRERSARSMVDTLDLAFRTGEPILNDARPVGYLRNGVPVLLTYLVQALRDPSGAVDGLFVLALDVTAPARAAELDRELNHRIADVLRQLPVGVLALDGRRRIVAANDALRRFTGGVPDLTQSVATIRRVFNVRDVGSPHAALPSTSEVVAMIDDGERHTADLVLTNPATGSDVRVRLLSAPLHDEDGRISGRVLVYTDLPE
jgi:PAS domain-containing protein